MAFNAYTTLPTVNPPDPQGRPTAANPHKPPTSPPIENGKGAYYYKYSLSWTSKSARTDASIKNASLKYDTDDNKKAISYIFVICQGQYSSVELGIMTAKEYQGVWKPYFKKSKDSQVYTQHGIEAIVPDTKTPSNNIYTSGREGQRPRRRQPPEAQRYGLERCRQYRFRLRFRRHFQR